MALTVALSLGSVLITWLISLPIGIFSAVKQSSAGDYIATFLGFVGISVPSFLIALVVMYIMFKYFDTTVGGLFSSAMDNEPWSWEKIVDLFGHRWLPIVILLYLVVIFAEFLSPFGPGKTSSLGLYAPPQPLAFDSQGAYVYGYTSKIDPVALRRIFVVDETKREPIGFFVKGFPYKLFGFIEMDVHLFGPQNVADPIYLLGGDSLGRDLLSRFISGTRTSMTIGLVGVAFSLIFSIILGGISGYFGGLVDTIIQRLIEFLRSVPSIPL